MINDLLNQKKKIVLFDGECNLCDRWVRFLLRHDPKDTFRFASLQSEIGKKIQREYGIDPLIMNSVVVIDKHSEYKTKTSALFSLTDSMGGLWPLLRIFWIIPQFLRDWKYDFIAGHRYLWFGQRTCLVMTDDIRHKFLGSYE